MNERVPVVWVVNYGGHNYAEAAERFGRLIPLTTGSVNPFNPDRLAVNISEKIKVADVMDYVLISGAPILNGIVMMLWLLKFRNINILQWSNRDKEYKHLILSADNLARLAETAA